MFCQQRCQKCLLQETQNLLKFLCASEEKAQEIVEFQETRL